MIGEMILAISINMYFSSSSNVDGELMGQNEEPTTD